LALEFRPLFLFIDHDLDLEADVKDFSLELIVELALE
jgi:hypothetical protein